MDWREVAGNWLWVPPQPRGIIHFLGGAFVASAPHLTYRLLLESLGREGYLIVATPFVNTFDHRVIAQEVDVTFGQALVYLERRGFSPRSLPVYGLGHSMGGKIHLLLSSLGRLERVGNVLMAFNNYSARRSIPLLEQFMTLTPDLDLEFTPSPPETLALVRDRYPIHRNLLIRFSKDDIDENPHLGAGADRQIPPSHDPRTPAGHPHHPPSPGRALATGPQLQCSGCDRTVCPAGIHPRYAATANTNSAMAGC
jgi:hypothetical protein